jgi:lipopolysaccharide biosynthesis glycosyltransferase
MTFPVYIGYDRREPRSYEAAVRSLHLNADDPVIVHKLDSERLADTGLLRRPQDTRGQRYDILSNANASTEFAISRFLVPILQQSGWALFVDSDVIFLGDVADLFALADPSKAVMCVKHQQEGGPSTKMDGQLQQFYARKNWSSVMLFNCDHPANRRLSLVDVQERRGLYLHSFGWLHDSELGELPQEWNFLVGVSGGGGVVSPPPKLLHFTLGTPELGVCSLYDREWFKYAPPSDLTTAAA